MILYNLKICRQDVFQISSVSAAIIIVCLIRDKFGNKTSKTFKTSTEIIMRLSRIPL